MATAYSSSDSENNDDLSRCFGELSVEPYMFEPTKDVVHEDRSDSSEESESAEDERPERAGNNDWCCCGNVCSAQTTGRESMCCSDYSPVQAKKDSLEPNGVECITQHPGFRSNCLDQWVLERSMYEYIEDQGPIGDDQPVFKLYRYIAYRNFVRWIWKRLGRRNRLPLPVCARDKIRETWPSPDNIYTGFKYPKFD